MCLGGIILISYSWATGKSLSLQNPKAWVEIILIAFLLIFLANMLECWALDHISAAKTCFLFGLAPITTMLFERIKLGTKLGYVGILGLSLSLSGYLLGFNTDISEGLPNASLIRFLPEIAVIGSVLAASYGWVGFKHLLRYTSLNPSIINGYVMLVGGLLSIFYSLVFDQWNPLPISSENTVSFALGLAISALVSNVICFSINGFLLKHLEATFLSVLGLISPSFILLVEYLFSGQALSITILFATLLMFSGAIILQKSRNSYSFSKIN